jgi:hypothetical protein
MGVGKTGAGDFIAVGRQSDVLFPWQFGWFVHVCKIAGIAGRVVVMSMRADTEYLPTHTNPSAMGTY